MKRFSERIGVRPVKDAIQKDGMDDDLRNGVWNLVYMFMVPKDSDRDYLRYHDEFNKLAIRLWLHFFKAPIDTLPTSVGGVVSQLREYFYGASWEQAYDFVEFVIQERGDDRVVELFNDVLERELSAYRFVDKVLTPISSESERVAIAEALSRTEGIGPVHTHLAEALNKLADRKSPDYRNSIKESISAVEALVNIISGTAGTLGDALKRVGGDVHPALAQAFSKLYGWSSDASGIRHALMDEPDLAQEDALFMLVACAGFVSYLLAKASKAGVSLFNES